MQNLKILKGTGLGLAIVKHIAIRHETELKITSKVNVGTTIEIFLKKLLNICNKVVTISS